MDTPGGCRGLSTVPVASLGVDLDLTGLGGTDAGLLTEGPVDAEDLEQALDATTAD